jgi:flavin reductase (DIM6/NTAB) family NADH-FMN oxidoreductase RutF
MYSFEPKELPVPKVHQFLLSGVAPRPISFVSTRSLEGINNLAPFSFYNAFGANPPIVAFSAARSGRTGITKDTYENLVATKECVIHCVSYSMVDQINLASCEYESDIDEFIKAGFTAIESDIVKAKRVKEAPFQMECKLLQMVELGGKAGSGNLAICEVVKFHISEAIMRDGMIDPELIDLVGRNGQDFYTRANGNALFELRKPGLIKGIGFDGLPKKLLNSQILTAGNLAKLAMVDSIPNKEEANIILQTIRTTKFIKEDFNIAYLNKDYKQMSCYLLDAKQIQVEQTIQTALSFNDVEFAWAIAIQWLSKE